MKLFVFQHASFESPGFIADWADNRTVDIQLIRVFSRQDFPPVEDAEGLILLGGPMSIHDTVRFSWLVQEKIFLEKWLKTGKPVMGICLGAQLLADLLGGRVYSLVHQEIGWFPIQKNAFLKHPFLDLFSENTLPAFHWHGETFDIPEGAVPLFSSEATQNQAFIWNNQIFAFQFHWEVTPKNVQLLIENGETEMRKGGPFVQSPEKMLLSKSFFETSHQLISAGLDFIFFPARERSDTAFSGNGLPLSSPTE